MKRQAALRNRLDVVREELAVCSKQLETLIRTVDVLTEELREVEKEIERDS